MKSPIVVSIEDLGKCEHCSSHFVIGDKFDEIADGDGRCQICGGRLNLTSCGMVEIEGPGSGVWARAQWIDPRGVWSAQEPEHPFTLGKFRTFPSAHFDAVAS